MSYFQDLDKDTKRLVLAAWNLLVKPAKENSQRYATGEEMQAFYVLDVNEMQYPFKVGHGR